MKKTLLIVLLLSSFMVYAQNDKSKEQIKPALIVIDIQNTYLPLMSEDDKKTAMRIINGAIWFFHQNNLPVIRVYNSDLRWGPEDGTEEFDYPKSVIIKETDPKVVKHVPNAFTKTELDKILKEKGCNTLFLCGLSAVGCVLATYQGGIDNGYKTFMIKEGIMSNNPNYTNMIKDVCESVSFETMMYFLQKMN